MSNNAKDLRKQLRNIAQELLPNLLIEELKSKLYKELQVEVKAKLESIEALVKDSLTQIDNRQKDMQSFMLRNMAASNVESNQQNEDPPSDSL